MRLAEFTDLISNMPVTNQAFTSKRITWTRYMKEGSAASALQSIFNAHHKDLENIFLSRGDLQDLASKPDLAEFVMATIVWGYPRGMRGYNFRNICIHLDKLCEQLLKARSPILDWISHYEEVRTIPGIALSTYSKLLHFMSSEIEGQKALILDQRIVAVIQRGLFEELAPLRRVTSARLYPKYLEGMQDVAAHLSLPSEKLEFFLFEFGLHLKYRGNDGGVGEIRSNRETIS